MTRLATAKVIREGQFLDGKDVSLRLVELNDCNDTYVKWLNDPDVKKYLETRWNQIDLASVKDFVTGMIQSPDNYLFAIIEKSSGRHIGNLKVGPINAQHSFADISYFIGEKTAWGKGYATEAIRLATDFAFQKLELHRLQAGFYEGNIGSGKALEKAGYAFEAKFKKQLKGPNGWEDHLWYAKINTAKVR